MNKNEWLLSLNEGDEVLVSDRWRYEVRKIEKITKTRQIKLGGWVFKEGVSRGKTIWDHDTYIEPVTQEVIDRIRKRTLAKTLNDFDFGSIGLNDLESVLKIIESNELPSDSGSR